MKPLTKDEVITQYEAWIDCIKQEVNKHISIKNKLKKIKEICNWNKEEIRG